MSMSMSTVSDWKVKLPTLDASAEKVDRPVTTRLETV